MSVSRTREGLTGFVTLDNPPVNAVGREMRAGLLDAVAWAEAERLDRVIVTGAGRAFAAGADAREFDGAPLEPHLPDVLDAIERSFVPWIAAINGVALGGGAEIALACRMRIAGRHAQIGLPEVTLGVIPGAGGTQRAMRLCGLERALEMVAFGRPLGVADALAAGLVHSVEDDPVEAADMVNTEELLCVVPTWELPAPVMDAAAFAAVRDGVARRMAGQVAPLRAVEVIEAGLALPFAEAMAVERAAFLELKGGAQARALRHLFFAERAAKAPALLEASAADLTRIVVVGGGTMGAGIAYACLSVGISVVLLEMDDDAVARAEATIGKRIADGVKRGRLDESLAEALRGRLVLSRDYGDAAGVGLVIEAAFEAMEVKREIFARLDEMLGPEAVLATNTSYLDVDEIAAGTHDPSRVVGLHFFAPAHVMRLLEIVKGARTGDRALATGYALAKMLKKVPVLAGVCDGFIGNRIFSRYKEEADFLLMDGAVPWEVDEAMEAFGYAMGPFEVQDLSGLDIGYANRRRQDGTRDPARRYVPISDRMVQEGRLGRKASVGWYRYPGGSKVVDPLLEDMIVEEARFAKVERREIGAEEVVERLVLAMINEAAEVLGEGVAQSAADIDLVTVFGYGFPRWRGGLMHYADEVGVAEIVRRIRGLEARDPVVWTLSATLLACEAAGVSLAEWRRA
jgi:3-hydroxyacyl-CoA dehydrogenase